MTTEADERPPREADFCDATRTGSRTSDSGQTASRSLSVSRGVPKSDVLADVVETLEVE